jgi:hypothetical protein
VLGCHLSSTESSEKSQLEIPVLCITLTGRVETHSRHSNEAIQSLVSADATWVGYFIRIQCQVYGKVRDAEFRIERTCNCSVFHVLFSHEVNFSQCVLEIMERSDYGSSLLQDNFFISRRIQVVFPFITGDVLSKTCFHSHRR